MSDIVFVLAVAAVVITWLIVNRPRRHDACKAETARAVQAVKIAQSDERAARLDARLAQLEQINARTKALADDLNTR